MKLYAKVKIDGNLSIIEGTYKTKKAFKEDLQANGYTVQNIYTELQYWALDYVTFPKDVFNKEILAQIVAEYR